MSQRIRRAGDRAGRVAVALFLATLPACRAAHMPIPEELIPVTTMPVSGRQGFLPGRHLSFGAFEVRELDRSWTRGRERDDEGPVGLRTAEGQYRQRYAFHLYDGDREIWRAQCQTDAQAVARETALANVTEVRRALSLECLFTPPDSAAPTWRLALEATGERPPAGAMAGEGRRFQVEGIAALQGTSIASGRPSGYYVLDGVRALAAIEVLNDGAVRIALDLSPADRDAIGGAAMALLLFDDLQDVTDQLAPGK